MNLKEKLRALCVHEVLYNNENEVALAGSVLHRETERDGVRERAVEGSGPGPSKGQSMGQKLCMKIVAEKVRSHSVTGCYLILYHNALRDMMS